jgi:uncharacterized protein YehS (DUF1456 family)
MPLSNNDTLKRLRYNLNLNDNKLVEIFRLSQFPLERDVIQNMLKKNGEEGFIDCSDAILSAFLDGFIIKRRGRRDHPPTPPPRFDPEFILSNNDILKKLRIALELKEDDVIAIMKKAGADITRSELGALFRQKDSKNFKPCGDQFLRNFITGLKDVYNKQAGAQDTQTDAIIQGICS